jgi:hypothetical protein
MVNEPINITEDYDLLIESIQRNIHHIQDSQESKFYKFNNRMLLSNSIEFLDAVKYDMGGEIIQDSAIGSFLYFGTDTD